MDGDVGALYRESPWADICTDKGLSLSDGYKVFADCIYRESLVHCRMLKFLLPVVGSRTSSLVLVEESTSTTSNSEHRVVLDTEAAYGKAHRARC